MPQRTGTSIAGSSFRIARVTDRLRSAAASRLLGPDRGGPDSAEQFLNAAEVNGINLEHFWVSMGQSDDSIRQACLVVPGSGRSAMTFTSAPSGTAEEKELASVVTAALARLPGVHISQALLESHETGANSALIEAGFFSVGVLAYMRRPAPARSDRFKSHSEWPQGVFVRRYQSSDDPGLIAALDRSYEQTLDCPELCGLRDTSDVLESHRASGHFDPAHWWVAERDRKIEGMLLFNPCPEMGTVELVYVGLAPSLRGCGFGRRLMEHGLAHLVGTPELHVTCAVDERNAPALRLYGALGFVEFARRFAFVKSLRRSPAKSGESA